MPTRFNIASALFLAGFAAAGPVLQARHPVTSDIVTVTTQEGSPTVAFTSSLGAQVTVSEWTQVAATTTYIGAWTSSMGASGTSAPFPCTFPVSVATTEIQTSSVSEPSAVTMVEPVTSACEPSAVTVVTPVTSVSEPSAVTMVVPATIVSGPSGVTIVVPFTSVSASPNIATICPSQPVPSTQVIYSTQSPVAVTTQSFVVPTTQSQVAVTTQSTGAENLVLNTNSAMLQVVSTQLAAVATFFGLLGASVTLLV